MTGAQQRGLSLEETARICLDAGVTGLEFLSRQYDEATLEKLRVLQKAGMRVNGYPAFTDLIHNPSDAAVDEVVRQAVSIGARGILLIPGFLEPGDCREEVMERSLPAVEKMCRRAGDAGVYVGMEDYDSELSPVSGSEGLLWYLDRAPELSCIFDTGNFHYSGEDTLSAYRKLKRRITRQAHLKDRALTPRPCVSSGHSLDGRPMYPCAVGDGDIPIGEILSDLAEAGFDGSLTLEMFGHPDYVQGLISSVAFVRRFFPQV